MSSIFAKSPCSDSHAYKVAPFLYEDDRETPHASPSVACRTRKWLISGDDIGARSVEQLVADSSLARRPMEEQSRDEAEEFPRASDTDVASNSKLQLASSKQAASKRASKRAVKMSIGYRILERNSVMLQPRCACVTLF